MTAPAAPARSATDIGEVLDAGHWTTLQKAVVALAALSIVMDGFDGQLIGFAVPVLGVTSKTISETARAVFN